MSNELIIIMVWCWLNGYSAGLESAGEKIKRAFAEIEEEEDDHQHSYPCPDGWTENAVEHRRVWRLDSNKWDIIIVEDTKNNPGVFTPCAEGEYYDTKQQEPGLDGAVRAVEKTIAWLDKHDPWEDRTP